MNAGNTRHLLSWDNGKGGPKPDLSELTEKERRFAERLETEGYAWVRVDADGITGWMLAPEEGDGFAIAVYDDPDEEPYIRDWAMEAMEK